ncbi:hypothetical protein OGA58_004475 [Salmonella enterica]|nr:hypothetical protein [Salmonella enterica]
MNQVTPALLAEQARAKGTAILTGEPCTKCREPEAIYFYARPKDSGEGLRVNGCLWCRHIESRLGATANSNFLTPATMTDDNGTPIYEGRACKVCRSKMRLGVHAYGSKQGTCRACAIHQQQEKEHGKQIKRASQRATAKLHKVTVQSIERSGAVEVAPRSLVEYLELKDLVYRCELMNQREQALGTKINWVIAHKYPAAGAGEGDTLRGKVTADNLYLVQQELNWQDGNSKPESWTDKQVISIAGCRAIMNSQQAAKAWIERRTWDKKLTPAEKKARTIAERKAWGDHAERVKKIAADAVGVMEFFAATDNSNFLTFEAMRQQVETRWNKTTLQMDRVITAAIQSGRTDAKYAEVREQRLTADAFCGANSRLWLVVMTFQQLADAIEIITETDKSIQTAEQVETVKRCAVLWAIDVLNNPGVLVMGFTHPLLSVMGEAWTWGTREDEATGKEWLCVWRNPTSDELTGFDGEQPPEDEINPALTVNCNFPTPEPVHDYGEGWQSTATDYLYEQRKEKARREAREQRQREQEAAAERQRTEEAAALSKRIAYEAKAAVEGLEPLYWYASAEWEGANLDFAHRLIADVMERATEHQNRIKDCTTAAELNSLLVAINYEQRHMRQPENVFSDLLRPF